MLIKETGWTPEQISKLNIQTITLLIDTWGSTNKKDKKNATAQDVKNLQSFLQHTK